MAFAISGVPSSESEPRDLKPLRGMPIKDLNLAHFGHITDLTPLKGMPLTSLNIYACFGIEDLTPLRGMPLTTRTLGSSKITDLRPLKDMPITDLKLMYCTGIRDLTPKSRHLARQGARKMNSVETRCLGICSVVHLGDVGLDKTGEVERLSRSRKDRTQGEHKVEFIRGLSCLG